MSLRRFALAVFLILPALAACSGPRPQYVLRASWPQHYTVAVDCDSLRTELGRPIRLQETGGRVFVGVLDSVSCGDPPVLMTSLNTGPARSEAREFELQTVANIEVLGESCRKRPATEIDPGGHSALNVLGIGGVAILVVTFALFGTN